MIISNENTNNNTKDTRNMETNNIPFSIPFPGTENKSNDWMNNPFIYLVLLWLFGSNGFGGFNRGYGLGPVGAGTIETQALSATQIDDIRSKVAEISAQVACGAKDLSGLECAMNGLGIQVGSVKDSVLGVLNSIDKEIASGNLNLVKQICDCCCSIKSEMSAGFCGIEKEVLRQTNAIQQGLSTLGFQHEKALNQVNNSITTGFANLGFQSERNTNQIVQAIQAEACTTRGLMAQYHNEDIVNQKNLQISALQDRVDQLSQSAQTAVLLNAINSKTTTTTPAA